MKINLARYEISHVYDRARFNYLKFLIFTNDLVQNK